MALALLGASLYPDDKSANLTHYSLENLSSHRLHLSQSAIAFSLL